MQQIQLELEAFRAQRMDLAQQLEILTSRRGQLADQIARAPGSLRAAPEARLGEIDARIAQLEKEALQTDNRISELLKRAATESPTIPVPPVSPVFEVPPPGFYTEAPVAPMHDPRFLKIFGLEAAGFLLLTMVLCRWTWLRARARFAPRPMMDNSQLQHAVDAIAIEVERISEGQRFVTNLLDQRLTEKRDKRPNETPAVPKFRTVTPV